MFGSMTGNRSEDFVLSLFPVYGHHHRLFISEKKEKWGFTTGRIGLGSFHCSGCRFFFCLFLNFSKTAHILALAAMALVTAFLWLKVSDH